MFFFSILNMVQSFERLDFDLGLRFWSSTTHLRLHSITASTVILVQGYVSLLCQLSAPITSLQRCIRKVRMIFLELLTCAFYIYVSLNFKLISVFSPTQVRNNFLFIYLLLLLQGQILQLSEFWFVHEPLKNAESRFDSLWSKPSFYKFKLSLNCCINFYNSTHIFNVFLDFVCGISFIFLCCNLKLL